MFDIDHIMEQIACYKTRYVTVTGGEPLAQENTPALLDRLLKCGYKVSLETSGALDISKLNPQIIKIMDLKTPASGEESRNLYTNIEYLNQSDEVKFVICNHDDYNWSKVIIDRYQLISRCQVLFSPSSCQYSATMLAEQILQDQLPVRFQTQLHKFLWNDAQGK